MLMLHTVRACEPYHRPRELPIPAILVREFGSVEDAPDLLILLVVIAPFEPRVPPFDIQPQIDRLIFHRDPCIQEFRLFSVLQADYRQRALSQRLAVIFPQIDIVHVVIVEDQSGAVLMNLRREFHLRGDPGIHTGQLPCKDADLVKRSPGFLSADAHISRPCRYISKPLRHHTRGIIIIPKFLSVKIIKLRYLRHGYFRQRCFRHFCFRKIASVRHTKPAVLSPHHLLNRRLPAQGTSKLRHKRSCTEMHQIYFLIRQFYIASVPGLLKDGFWIVISGF